MKETFNLILTNEAAMNALLALLTAIATIMGIGVRAAYTTARTYAEKSGIEIEDKHARILAQAFENGARSTITVDEWWDNNKQKAIAGVIDYASKAAGDAMAALNPDPEVLRKKALSALSKAATEKAAATGVGKAIEDLAQASKIWEPKG